MLIYNPYTALPLLFLPCIGFFENVFQRPPMPGTSKFKSIDKHDIILQ